MSNKKTTLENLVNKAVKKTASMFTPVKTAKLSKHAENVKVALSNIAGNIKHDLAKVLSAAMGEEISVAAVQPRVEVGAVLFAVSKNASGRHGYALRRPFLVAENAGSGYVKGVRFHSGNVGKAIHLNDTRRATAAEAKAFFRNNWEAKRSVVTSILA